MTGTRLCCCVNYTTRKYDASGNTIWSANYFDGYSSGSSGMVEYVTSQCIDGANVYVGGGRVTDGTNYWSLRAYDISSGGFLWQRDLQADVVATGVTYGTGTVREMSLDNNGNIVCLLKARPAGIGVAANSLQAFVVVNPSGGLVAVRKFTPELRTGIGDYSPALSFCVNQDGDYHWVAMTTGNIYEWISPFTSAVVTHPIAFEDTVCIRRFGGANGRDYIGFQGSLPDISTGSFPLIWKRGVVQPTVPYASGDFDLSASYQANDGTGNWLNCFETNVISTVRDIAIDGNGNIIIAGGTFTTGVSSAGCAVTYNTVRQWNSSGVFQWATVCDGKSLAVDSSNNIYISGDTNQLVNAVNYEKRDSSANHVWGHHHAFGGSILTASGETFVGSFREVNVSGTTTIRTGGGEFAHAPNTGPQSPANDINFISSPCASVAPPPACTMSIGRTATGYATKAGTTYNVTFAGAAPSAGTWLVAVVWDETQLVPNITISSGGAIVMSESTSGGSSMNFTGLPGMVCFIYQASNSLSNVFTVSYAGAANADSACCTIMELVPASGHVTLAWLTTANNTDVSPSALVTSPSTIIIVATSGQMSAPTQPSGMTLQGSVDTTSFGVTPVGATAIATVIPAGTGTYNPGNWTMSSTTTDELWTIYFQCGP